MLGPIVNMLAILAGTALGMFIKGADKYEKQTTTAIALFVFFLGTTGVISGLQDPDTNLILFVLCLIVGSIFGEIIKIDYNIKRLGDFLGKRFSDSGKFAQGFVKASFMYCIGAMAIIGSFESGLSGNHSVLFAKSTLDGVCSIILASTYGIGVGFSALVVIIYEGLFTLLASFLSPIFTADSLRDLSTIGNVLIACIGLDMLEITKINYANMLPAVFLPIIFYLPIFQSIITSITELF